VRRVVLSAPIVPLPAERHEENRGHGVVARKCVTGDADVDVRLRHIEAQRTVQPIPPREYRRPVCVRLVKSFRMMDAVHARRDKNEIQPALPGHWQPYVAVLKQRVELKDELIDDKGQRWPADQRDLHGTKCRGVTDFDKMKPHGGGDVEVGIDVMRVVEPP